MLRVFLCSIMVLAGVTVSCRKSADDNARASNASEAATNQRVFQVKGVVNRVKPDEKQVYIKHEAIPDYMPAMTMPFDVKDTNELAGLEPGQAITFRLIVTDTDGWIDQIRKVESAATNAPPANAQTRLSREVEPLEVGDPLPEYQFTNQFGQPISTGQYQGQALAINFLFTRCPFPTYCPLLANRFAEAQQKLAAMNNGPTNWQLLTISFDPEFDQPVVLKAYAEKHQYNPAHWTFATGQLIDITAIGEQFELAFWRDPSGSISHNLRTAVVDASGRVQKVFDGNNWTSEELVTEMVKAAKAGKP